MEYEKVGLDEGAPVKGGASPVVVSATEYRDKPFAIAFLLHLVLVLGVLASGTVVFFTMEPESQEATVEGESTDVQEFFPPFTLGYALGFFGVTALSGAVCGAFALVYLKLMKAMPKLMVYASMGFSLALMFGMGAILLVFGAFIPGFIFIAFGLIFMLLYFLWRKRMAFTAHVLEVTMQVLDYQTLNFYVAFGGLVAYFVWFVVFTFTVIVSASFSLINEYITVVVSLYLLFSWYWTLQVIKNVVHVTIAGAVASWYFQSDAAPDDATKNALRRACTTSFGSICFGSLIVALIETMRALAESGKGQNNILAIVARCLLYCIEAIAKLFNKYAFTQVAIYGHSYIESCKATLELLKRSGIRVIMTDILVGNVLTMGSLIGAVISSFTAVLLAYLLTPEYPYLAIVIGLFLGYGIVVCSLEVVDSAVTALMVCLCTQPAVLARHFPALYEELRTKYGPDRCGVFAPNYQVAV